MSEAPRLLTKLAADWPPESWRDVTVLVAVSGGADSVALVRALHQLSAGGDGRLIVAHFNHALRGAESDGDQAFVEELGRKLGLAVVSGDAKSAKVGDGQGGRSESALRTVRYEFLTQTAKESGARYVALAHTADDQVETVLHNILRGTGLAGLAGIPRVRTLTEAATLVRPMLGVTRAEVLEYLAALDQSYREDSSNQQLDYTRNRIRHELLPLLERDYHPHVRAALARLSQIAGAAEGWVQQQVEPLLSRLTRPIEGGVEIHVLPDLGTCYAIREAWRRQGWPLQDMSYEKWDQLFAFAQSPANAATERQVFPGNIRAEKQGGVLRLTRPAT